MKSRLEKVYSKLPNQKVNLKTQKVELALGDELANLQSKAETEYENLDNSIENAFSPLIDVEKAALEIPESIDGLPDFMSALLNLESAYNSDLDKYREYESELGVSIPLPQTLIQAERALVRLQGNEQYFRDSINEFNEKSKKYRR